MQTSCHTIWQQCFVKLRMNAILNRTPLQAHRALHSSNSPEWPSNDVRRHFLDFFCNKYNHEFVKSSSVMPGKNQGTYFTNAGMNQFKPIFLGTAPDGSDLSMYRKVANSQKCVRIGGKHNDLDDVGHDLTHHTFFEMLGSWSFGNYFKKEACGMALQLLIEVYKLPMNRLYFTYFGGCPELSLSPDTECMEIWRELGVPDSQLIPFGVQDNFWDMGDTGPCGPCSEIHFDHVGNRNASCLVNTGSPEVVEIWNLVFMQYNRLGEQKLVALPSTHVDTGMGLERLCAVLKGTMSNYNTDLFLPIFDAIHKETGVPVYNDMTGSADVDNLDTAYRIIADHSRMATVCISDGLLPGRLNLEHRLRVIIYKALYQCHQLLKAKPGLLGKLVTPISEILGATYPEIATNAEKVREVLDSTEEKYIQSHTKGRKNFEKLLIRHPQMTTLYGDDIRRLHDGHYGDTMSVAMVEVIAGQLGLHIDASDFDKFTEFQGGGPICTVEVEYPSFTAKLLNDLAYRTIQVTNDVAKYEYAKSATGIYEFPVLDGRILCLVDDNNKVVDRASEGDNVGIVLDRTQFYAEKGGQMGDKGVFKSQTGTVEITDTQSSHDYVLHIGTVTQGFVDTSQSVTMDIDAVHRSGCMRNHTATHLVNSALRHCIGTDVAQTGSAVAHNKLTFDFSCWARVTDEVIEKIHNLVIETIEAKLPVHRQLVPLKQALKTDGIVYLQDVIYPSSVYAVSVHGQTDLSCVSHELCGGTHVINTGDLEDFCITGVRGQTTSAKTIVCVTGELATQAKLATRKVDEVYTELVDAVKHNDTLEYCKDLQKQIYVMLEKEVLPKLYKDQMFKKIAAVGTDINTAINRQAFIKLKQDLTERMYNQEEYIVLQFSVKVLLRLNKMMKSVQVTKPLILVVETSKNVVAYVAFPQGSEEIRAKVVMMLCEAVFGRVTQSEENYEVISTKGKQSQIGNHSETLLDLSNQLLKDLPKKEIESKTKS